MRSFAYHGWNIVSAPAPVGVAVLLLVAMLAKLSPGPVHLVQRSLLREEMQAGIKAGLPMEKVTRFVFEDAGPSPFEEGESEFVSNGTRYDVVSTYALGNGRTLVFAIADQKETALDERLEGLVHERMGADRAYRERELKVVSMWDEYSDQISAMARTLVASSPFEIPRYDASICGRATFVDPAPPRRKG